MNTKQTIRHLEEIRDMHFMNVLDHTDINPLTLNDAIETLREVEQYQSALLQISQLKADFSSPEVYHRTVVDIANRVLNG